MTDATNTETAATDAHDHGWVHIVPLPVLLGVAATLLVLTFLTVAATWIDLGNLNLVIAVLIATVKATLVVLFFMHMAYDRSFCSVVFLAALVFVALFIGIVLLDSMSYEPAIYEFHLEQLK